MSPCATTKSVVLIPSVRKGLCNQRLRMVQDIMIAHLFGAAVVLPQVVFSRQRCSFKAACYLQYTGEVSFGAAYDTGNTSRALAAAGICVLTPQAATARFGAPRALYGGTILAKTSKSPGGLVVLPAAVSELLDAAPLVSGKLDGQVWSTADAATCCTLVVPDSKAAIGRLRQVNAAFLPAPRVASRAELVLKRFYSSALYGGYTRFYTRAHEVSRSNNTLAQRKARSSCVPVAIHWRGQPDMAASSHALDVTAYTLEAARLLRAMPAGSGLCLLVLGGASASELATLHASLTSAFERVGGSPGSTLRLYSKETLLPRMSWSEWFGGYDDLVGMVDLEIARRVTAFVGSPFSSFSVVAATMRRVSCTVAGMCAQQPVPPLWVPSQWTPWHYSAETEMVPVDVSDQLGRIFALQFPYSDEESEDRCESLATLHDWKKPGEAWSCPTQPDKPRPSPLDSYPLHPRPRHPQCEVLGTSLRVSPPIDAPSRLGFNCTHSVITALYGGYDKLANYSRSFQANLERQEREQGVRTCWFAFTDAASVPELSVHQIALAEAASNSTTARGQPWVRAGIWNLVILPEGQLTAMLPERNKLRSRLPKMMAHCVLGYSSHMLYLDAKVSLRRPASMWLMLNQLSGGDRSGSAWVSPLHSARLSVRDELVCRCTLSCSQCCFLLASYLPLVPLTPLIIRCASTSRE